MSLTIEICGADGQVRASGNGTLVYEPAYEEGDCIRVRCEAGCHLAVQLDDALAPALVYAPEAGFTFPVPFGEARSVYSPRAFTGTRHLLTARRALPEETAQRRNLALNPYAVHAAGGPFPRADANVETRGEAVFAAKNAIDGITANAGHGPWPYTSWGINRDPSAAMTVSFGRPVQIDEAVVFLRADFPHDAWWESAVLHFSDGSELTLALEKSDGAQRFPFPPKTTEWVRLDTLRKADDPSPFPALSQLMLFGIG